MSVQDEQNQKLAKITMDASKVTLKSFAKTVKFLAVNSSKLPRLKTKQSLKTLSKTEKSISKIDLENLELKKQDIVNKNKQDKKQKRTVTMGGRY